MYVNLWGTREKKRKYFFRHLVQKIKAIRGPLACLGDWNYIWNRAHKIG